MLGHCTTLGLPWLLPVYVTWTLDVLDAGATAALLPHNLPAKWQSSSTESMLDETNPSSLTMQRVEKLTHQ